MRRHALYSSSRPRLPADEAQTDADAAAPAAAPDTAQPATPTGKRRRIDLASPRLLWLAILLLAAALTLSVTATLQPAPRRITQADIDKAVLRTMTTKDLPSEYAKAYENVRPSVVRVVSYVKKSRLKEAMEKAHAGVKGAKPKSLGPALDATDDGKNDEEIEQGVGTGVVIIDKGVILTNLHVVSGSDHIKVTFFDGLEADASITGIQPENDLAVLQAAKIPDDMISATMRSTGDLAPGDKVIAVGFPFGIGPSASGGVVSGLNRSFRSPEGKQEMNNLIQFDAAANPGNSGGPLVTMDGHVVGIVTAILNPTPARTFIGIGFAVPIENAAAAAGLPPF
jgi:S1-C subfamily serine protease